MMELTLIFLSTKDFLLKDGRIPFVSESNPFPWLLAKDTKDGSVWSTEKKMFMLNENWIHFKIWDPKDLNLHYSKLVNSCCVFLPTNGASLHWLKKTFLVLLFLFLSNVRKIHAGANFFYETESNIHFRVTLHPKHEG